jgi:hypothetical protein
MSGPSGSLQTTVPAGRDTRVTRVRALSCNSTAARAGGSRPERAPPVPIHGIYALTAWLRKCQSSMIAGD